MIADLCIVGDTVVRAEQLALFLGFSCHTFGYGSAATGRKWRRILVMQPHGRIMTEAEHRQIVDNFLTDLIPGGKVHWL